MHSVLTRMEELFAEEKLKEDQEVEEVNKMWAYKKDETRPLGKIVGEKKKVAVLKIVEANGNFIVLKDLNGQERKEVSGMFWPKRSRCFLWLST